MIIKSTAALTVFLLILFSTGEIEAQRVDTRYNLPAYDLKPIHYGFLVALHSSQFKLKYSDTFLDSVNVHSIMPRNSAGFSLGFVGNLRLGQYFDFRVTPAVGFYEFQVEYNYLNQTRNVQTVSSTNVELPFLIKYKSIRRKNTRMFLIAGSKVSLEASGRREEDEQAARLQIKDNNVFVEFGFGLDIYYPLFKFSPEIRFSKGLLNIINPSQNRFTTSIDRLAQNTVTLYLIVQ